MATSEELSALYGEIRAAMLTRHFALGRYFRANLVSTDNKLQFEGSKDDFPTDAAAQLLERWKIVDHDRENPLMTSGLLLTCLSVEHQLGRKSALPIINSALDSIDQLYKFKHDPHFSGYPIRHDAITSDRWNLTSDGKPSYCQEFLIDPGTGQYIYCTPLDDPRYDPRVPADEGNWDGELGAGSSERHCRFRNWEPSMDELIGLTQGYANVYYLVHDFATRRKVREQANRLGAYLSRHGYLLVRPNGGFALRGASGVLPASAFFFCRVFQRITGHAYPPSASFETALERAGVGDQFKWPLRVWSVLGSLMAPTAITLAGALGGLGIGLVSVLIGAIGLTLGPMFGYHIGRALALYIYRDRFDVKNDNSRGEFALAYLLSKIPGLRQRFAVAMWFMAFTRDFSVGFPPLMGLSALGDEDPSVAIAYQYWYKTRLALAGDHDYNKNEFFSHCQGKDDQGNYKRCLMGAKLPLATAVSFVLGNAAAKQRFDDDLQNMYERLNGVCQRNPELDDVNGIGENHVLAFQYMTCLALAWLQAKRELLGDSAVPTDTVLPGLPDTRQWPAAVIPASVVAAAATGGLSLPLLLDTGSDDDLPHDDLPHDEPFDPDHGHEPPEISDVLAETANQNATVEENAPPVVIKAPPRPPEPPPPPEPAGPDEYRVRLFHGSTLFSEGKRETFEWQPPYIDRTVRDRYHLTVCEEIFTETVFRSLDDHSFRILEYLEVISGRVVQHPYLVVVTIQVHSGGWWSHTGHYEGLWTLAWEKNP